jgi:hypothetical protein
MDKQSLPLLLGDFARILRNHGIATVFHAGKNVIVARRESMERAFGLK